jgi:hypothetical protein
MFVGNPGAEPPEMAESSETSMSFCSASAAGLGSKVAQDIEDKATEKAFMCSWVY